ncbi:hypothetical protein FHS61_002278 [Altererythrobacter atlanticus]|uniref:Uncharacterized protein n=1 Tax=Croceibacterium atlanticum TaxID=1267766 RepID=A0A0F7KRF3_9SPHN|nr:hypothetical protein [Croceibacterium atlanticum]AKH41787.1 hypothetical protein WYH_00733 [Croceibacterium atlanticum]MBB5733252.1 hypothetical protein [Croceibacterium atlanticum]
MSKNYIYAETPDDLRILVGWTADDKGAKLLLNLEGIQIGIDDVSTGDDTVPVDTRRFFMTRQQAVLLANFLYKMSGETPPPRKRGWLTRILGSSS